MTLSSAIVTEPDGSVFTSYTTLELPLTYYGPSVSLPLSALLSLLQAFLLLERNSDIAKHNCGR